MFFGPFDHFPYGIKVFREVGRHCLESRCFHDDERMFVSVHDDELFALREIHRFARFGRDDDLSLFTHRRDPQKSLLTCLSHVWYYIIVDVRPTSRKSRNMQNIIEVSNLTKTYDHFTAVDHISFDVEKGEVFAFLGPNGAGKTTTIKMLTTLLIPTSGNILLDGKNPVHDQSDARRSFGIVFQDPSLDDELTALENMEFHAVLYKVPKEIRRPRIEELMNFVELWNRRNDLVKEFSGGMKRRLEIARGLLHHPKILFLDEPTTGLDPQTRNHVWSYIKNLNEKEQITVFFTTHYIEEADRSASRVAIMDHGKIVARGTPDELKKQTDTELLEDAFIKLTGYDIRKESTGAVEGMRAHAKAWGRR